MVGMIAWRGSAKHPCANCHALINIAPLACRRSAAKNERGELGNA